MRISDWSSDVCSSDLIREVGSVAAEFARRSAERVQCREPRVLRFEREVERLAEILRQEAERIGALQWRRRIFEIGRASCRERVCQYVLISVGAVTFKNKNIQNRAYKRAQRTET